MSIDFSGNAPYVEEEPLVTTSFTREDESEYSLRPKTLREYIGQEKAKGNLEVFIQAAKMRQEPLDHVLLHGPPGLGKTTLSGIIANEMGVNVRITSGPAIEKAGDLAALLTNLNENDILFVDEIHRLNRSVEEVLYPAMEDYAIDIIIGKGPSANSIRLDLPKFTLIGATTRAGQLSAPLRDRFGVTLRLELYTPEELSMIVTRSASENNLNEDVIHQFTSQPMVLIMTSLAMVCLCFIGFPIPQVLTMSAMLMALGVVLMRSQQKKAVAAVEGPAIKEEVTSEADFYKNIDNVYNLLNVDQISMEFGYSLIPLVDEGSGGSFVDRVVMFRKQFVQEMGLVFPSVRLKDSGQLNPNQYSISIKGEQVAQGEVLVDHYLALAPDPDHDTLEGIETVEPAFGIAAKWISEDRRVKAELAGYTLIDPTSVIITHLSEVIKNHAQQLNHN